MSMMEESKVINMLQNKVAYIGWEISIPLYIWTDPVKRSKMLKMPWKEKVWLLFQLVCTDDTLNSCSQCKGHLFDCITKLFYVLKTYYSILNTSNMVKLQVYFEFNCDLTKRFFLVSRNKLTRFMKERLEWLLSKTGNFLWL